MALEIGSLRVARKRRNRTEREGAGTRHLHVFHPGFILTEHPSREPPVDQLLINQLPSTAPPSLAGSTSYLTL